MLFNLALSISVLSPNNTAVGRGWLSVITGFEKARGRYIFSWTLADVTILAAEFIGTATGKTNIQGRVGSFVFHPLNM